MTNYYGQINLNLINQMKKLLLVLPFFTLFLSSVSAQDTEIQPDSLRQNAVKLFIDCEFCDMNHIRQEIPYVNYVRDVKEAQVYLMETMRMTGSGGFEYTYFFSGEDKFAGLNDTLIYASRPDDTVDQTRQGRTDMIKMGLMRYVARTPIFKEVSIRHMGVGGRTGESEQVSDKWNNWVFEVETRPSFSWTDTKQDISLFNSLSATRVTPEWKIESNFTHRYSKTKFDFPTLKYTAIERTASLKNLVVKSISDHWSIGGKLDLLQSTFYNYEFQAEIYPSIEYNLFSYEESTHRQLRFLYSIGASLNQYMDTTIYSKTKENLPKQELQIAYQVQEKWGSVNVSIESSNLLNDFKKNRIEMNGNLSIRIVKGLQFSIRGGIAKIADQIYLRAEEGSDAEKFLELQEQATSYEIDGSVGLTYTFGSIFNNVVNPRFGNGMRYGGGGGGGYRF